MIKDLNHFNIAIDNEVYCRNIHKITSTPPCQGCQLINGGMNGAGVECIWEDEFIEGITVEPVNFPPDKELLRISKLMDAGVISKHPQIDGKDAILV